MRKNQNTLIFIILFAILVTCAGPILIVSGSEAGNSSRFSYGGSGAPVIIDFFYNPSCESCQRVLPIIKQYETNNTDIIVNYNNIAENQSNVEHFLQVQKDSGNVNFHVPVVIIRDQFLNGEENITQNLDLLVKETRERENNITPSVSPQSASEPVSSVNNSDQGGIHFFYNPSCESCQKVLPFIEQYAKSHPQTPIKLEDLSNQTNIERFSLFRGLYPDETFHLPVVFVGDTYLMGEEKIQGDFNSTVELYMANLSSGEPPVKKVTVEQTSSINPVVLLVAAIGEGLNPCGLLVLALLLVSLMATSTRKMVFFVGLAYICAFFIVRLLSGFAIFSVIQIPGIASAFTLAAAAIAIIAGVIQIKDGLFREQKPLLSIPDSKKGLISAYMKEASILGGFIAGILVGIYGMACTAGIYISILGMLYNDLTYGLLYLVLYNFIVIIPLVVILLLVFFGLSPETVNAWREGRKSLLRLMIGIIMVLMGVIILIPMI